MQTATSALINSCETSKWLSYTYYHIFCWMPRKFTLMLSFFPCVILNSRYKVEYTSIFNSCSFSIEVISWMLNSCCRGSICCCCCFKVLTKAKFSLNKLVFNGLIKILFRLVFVEINWNRGCSKNVRARQTARTMMSVHATCTQWGFCVHKITCT